MINIVSIIFSGAILLLLTQGVPCVLGANWVPRIIQQIFPYGKNNRKQMTDFVKAIQVPKSWFAHFYLFAAVHMLVNIAVLIYVLLLHYGPHTALIHYLNLINLHHRGTLVDPCTSIMVAVLFFLHVSRRLYETLHVNVFSKATMNLVHYFAGFVHYWGCCTTILACAADWSSSEPWRGSFYRNEAQYQQLIGVALFFYASYQQYRAHHQLASYRKKSNQKDRYFLPQGRLFDYVSCPNFLCEILIYVAFYLMLGFNHFSWILITVFVITNQVLAATMAHSWYRDHFKDYPRQRKAIIPFIY